MKLDPVNKILKSAESTFKIRLLAFLAGLFSLLLIISLIASMVNEFSSIEDTLLISCDEIKSEEESNFRDYAYYIVQTLTDMYGSRHPQSSEDINRLLSDFTAQYQINIADFSIVNDHQILLDKDPAKIGTASPEYDESIRSNIVYHDEKSKTYTAFSTVSDGRLILTIKGDDFDFLMKFAAAELSIKKFWFNNGFTLIYDEDTGNIIYDSYSAVSKKDPSGVLSVLSVVPDKSGAIVVANKDKLYLCKANSEHYSYCCGMYIKDAIADIFSVYRITIISTLALSIALYFFISRITKDTFVVPLNKVNHTLADITEGKLNETVESRDYTEFSTLSSNINSTVSKLKEYIEEANAKNAQDLENARLVQLAALPNVSKFMNEQETFDLYASMFPAKEVGGDFYDFYLIGNILYVLIADVSGKGIPAAMFMMNSKAVIKNLVESGKSLDEVFFEANNTLISDSKSNFFVTAWLGKLNLDTGELNFVNAGHNAPLIKSVNGTYEYLDGFKPNLVLSGLKNHKYRVNTVYCDLGDELYLYTDGVTEAINSSEELYGNDRLKDMLNSLPKNTTSNDICSAIKKNVDEFIGDAPQFDDITMLSVRFFGTKKYDYDTVADIDSTSEVIDFIEETLNRLMCSRKFILSLNLVCDEIFSNICNYAYPPNATTKDAKISLSFDHHNRIVKIVFIDHGKPFNPIRVNEPDSLGKNPRERQIGGLGIHIIKKQVDEIYYEYKNDMNILTILKKDITQ